MGGPFGKRFLYQIRARYVGEDDRHLRAAGALLAQRVGVAGIGGVDRLE